MTVTDTKFKIDGIEYIWCGGLGSVMKSYEYNIKRGELRAIDDVIFVAAMIEKRFLRKTKVNWRPIENVDFDWVRNFKQKIFTGF